MKHLFTLCTIFSLTIPQLQSHDEQAKKASLEIVAALSEDIATLIINAHHSKDPQVTKAVSINLITRIADIIATILMKLKERKPSRSMPFYSDAAYQHDLDKVIAEILQRLDYSHPPHTCA